MPRTVFQPTGAMKLSWRAFDSAAAGAPSGTTLGGWDVAAAAVDLSDPAQRTLGDYELIEELGRGGMGVVYRARQRSLGREVALKLLAGTLWTHPDAARRFAAEAAAAARMRHPNIVAIHEFGSAGERWFYSMEWVDGTDLAARLRAGALPAREAAHLLRELARAVHYAHGLNVLHLDLKPQNVMLGADGRARVGDFGLARPLDRAMSQDGDDVVAGTPAYMAPEQALLRAAEISRATDVYGLGAILYECLTGRAPFGGASVEDTLRAVAAAPLAPPRRLDAKIPRDLEAICLKCLQRDPAQRYASADDLAEDLGRLLDGNPVQARRLRWSERAWRWLAREPVTMGGLATAALLLAMAIGAWWWQLQRQADTEKLARDAFTASAEALTMPAPLRVRLETLDRIVAAGYPHATLRSPQEQFDFLERLRAAVGLRAGMQDPVMRDLSLRIAVLRILQRGQEWRSALEAEPRPLAWLLAVGSWPDGPVDRAVQRERVRTILQRVAAAPALSDPELALAASYCNTLDELGLPVEEGARLACGNVYERARGAAPRNALFPLLQPSFDDAARERWLAALASTPLDDYGARLYQDTLDVLEPIASRLAADDIGQGLSSRDIAAVIAGELLDLAFWSARARVLEPCRALDRRRDAATLDLCRRSLAAPVDGWTQGSRDAVWRAGQWRLGLAERGEAIPSPAPRFLDYELRARLIRCCTQQGAHPEWVRLRSTRGQLAAEAWLYRELGETPHRLEFPL